MSKPTMPSMKSVSLTDLRAAVKNRIAAWQREGDTADYSELLHDAFDHLRWAAGMYGPQAAIGRMLSA